MKRLTPKLLDIIAARAAVPKGFVLRRARSVDLPQIFVLAQNCFTYDVPERANLRYFLTRAHAAFFVVLHGEELAAYGFAEANLRTGRFYVNTVCAAPAWRGYGLARALYLALIDTARAAGYAAPTAHVEVDNAAAISLMEKLGFATAARIDNYYYDNGKAALLMRFPV